MTAKEILEELEASKKLKDLGYTEVQCDCCKGAGFIRGGKYGGAFFSCRVCDETGLVWVSPVTK
jgi:hypothetical protein